MGNEFNTLHPYNSHFYLYPSYIDDCGYDGCSMDYAEG